MNRLMERISRHKDGITLRLAAKRGAQPSQRAISSDVSLKKYWCSYFSLPITEALQFRDPRASCRWISCPGSRHTLYTRVFIVYPLIHSRGQGESDSGQFVEGDISARTSSKPVSSVAKNEAAPSSPELFLITPRNATPTLWLQTADGPHTGHRGLPAFIAAQEAPTWEYCSPFLRPTCRFMWLNHSCDLIETFMGDKMFQNQEPYLKKNKKMRK